MIPKIDKSKCINNFNKGPDGHICTTCCYSCKHDVIWLEGDPPVPAVVAPEQCKHCNECFWGCPVMAIRFVKASIDGSNKL